MISALLARKAIPYALFGLVLFSLAVGIYFGLKRIEELGAAKARISELEGLVEARDSALQGWRERAEMWEAEKQAAVAMQAKQNEELAAARRQAEQNRRKYRDALAELEQADRDCASRTVPPAVDGLLGQRH